MARRKRLKRKKSIRKPSQYIDWVNIHKIQCIVFTSACMQSFDGQKIVVGQYLYKLMRRIDRLESRIALEHEVMDKSYIALLQQAVDRMDEELENE